MMFTTKEKGGEFHVPTLFNDDLHIYTQDLNEKDCCPNLVLNKVDIRTSLIDLSRN